MNAAIYLRISQDRSGEELGVTRQRADCEALVARRGWTVHDVYIDNDVSATKAKRRPEWERMMADIEAGRAQVVVGWTIDRTLRSGRDRLRMLEVGKEHGITISLVRGSDMDLSTPAGRLAADILGAVALNEVETKADRQRAMHAQAARMGKRVGGRRPFGFEQDGVTVRAPEAAALTAAYHDYLAGTPLLAIARRWNEAGLLSGVPRADGEGMAEWNHSGVRSVLQNPRYMGMRRHRPEGGEATLHPAGWPALVPEHTWRAANALLDSAASEFKPRGGRRLLTGVARCGVCGTPLNAARNKAGPGAVAAYRCPNGAHVVRRAELLDEQITRLVLARLAQPDVVAFLAAAEDDGEHARLAAEAASLREQMDEIAHAVASGGLTVRQAQIANAGLASRLTAAESAMARAGRGSVLYDLTSSQMTRERWDALGVDQQRVVIGALLTVRVHPAGRGVRRPAPETVEVAWRAA
ncbi:MAG: recombinase family protein [Pseudonocardia sp.]|nr:recombinase family protein [Pseudonocardia sp.]